MHLDQLKECEYIEKNLVSCWFPLFKSVSNFFRKKHSPANKPFHLHNYAPFIGITKEIPFLFMCILKPIQKINFFSLSVTNTITLKYIASLFYIPRQVGYFRMYIHYKREWVLISTQPLSKNTWVHSCIVAVMMCPVSFLYNFFPCLVSCQITNKKTGG